MQASERLVSESKPSSEVTIERLANQIDSYFKKLTNATFNYFDRIQERLDELVSHFGTIYIRLINCFI